MVNIRMIVCDPMAEKLLTLFIESSADHCLAEPAELILLDARQLPQLPDLKRHDPAARIAVVSSAPEYTYPETAQAMGADGFWYLQPSEEAFVSLVKSVLLGERPFPRKTPAVPFGKISSDALTERELEVLQQLVSGKSDAQIAEALNCSIPTVKHHIQQMRLKTGFANRTQIAVCAVERGLILPKQQ